MKQNKNAQAEAKAKATIKPVADARIKRALANLASKRQAALDGVIKTTSKGKASNFAKRQPLAQASGDSVKAELQAKEVREEKSRKQAIVNAAKSRDERNANAEKQASMDAKAKAKADKQAAKKQAAEEKAAADKLYNAQVSSANRAANYDVATRDAANLGNHKLGQKMRSTLDAYGKAIGLKDESDMHLLFRVSRSGFNLPALSIAWDKVASLLEIEKTSIGGKQDYLPADRTRIAKAYNEVKTAHQSFINSVRDTDRMKQTVRGRNGKKAGSVSFRSVTSVALDNDKLAEKKADVILKDCMDAADQLLFNNANRLIQSAVAMTTKVDGKDKVNAGDFSLWRKMRHATDTNSPFHVTMPRYTASWTEEEVKVNMDGDTPAAIAFASFRLAAEEFRKAAKANS